MDPLTAIGTGQQASAQSPAVANLIRNAGYARKQDSYLTTLRPDEEAAFQGWVKKNKVPFDPSPTSDYDMRGFYRGMMMGDPAAKTQLNANDGRLHFTDKWKTPYHASFSADSQYATPDAPRWNDKDQLVTKDGKVVFDERAKRAVTLKSVAGVK